nr:MAG TPA: hypothetical protein [Myoviridae sp. ctfuG5]DAN24701.1 MAG TPA: hypothetical protein [Caudoviricetes sp.]
MIYRGIIFKDIYYLLERRFLTLLALFSIGGNPRSLPLKRERYLFLNHRIE